MQSPRVDTGYFCIPTLNKWTHSSAVVKLDESLNQYSLWTLISFCPGAIPFCRCFGIFLSHHLLTHSACFLLKAPSASPANCLPQCFSSSFQCLVSSTTTAVSSTTLALSLVFFTRLEMLLLFFQPPSKSA